MRTCGRFALPAIRQCCPRTNIDLAVAAALRLHHSCDSSTDSVALIVGVGNSTEARNSISCLVRSSSSAKSFSSGRVMRYSDAITLFGSPSGHSGPECRPSPSRESVPRAGSRPLGPSVPALSSGRCQGRFNNMPVGRSKSVPLWVIVQRKCQCQLFKDYVLFSEDRLQDDAAVALPLCLRR